MPPTSLPVRGLRSFTDGDAYGNEWREDRRRLDAWITEEFGWDPVTTVGLTMAFRRGIGYAAGVYVAVAGQNVVLTDNATNYLQRTPAGVISANTVAFTPTTHLPVGVATTAGGAITAFVDWREAVKALVLSLAPLASPAFTGTPTVPDDPYNATGWNGSLGIPTKNAVRDIIETIAPGAVAPVQARIIAIGDETTVITAGVAKVTFRMPHGATLVGLPRASLTTGSSAGVVTIDINEAGVSIFSTTLTIDQGEKTSTTAATPAVVSDTALADDAEITIDIDGAGTGATGLKVTLYWRPT